MFMTRPPRRTNYAIYNCTWASHTHTDTQRVPASGTPTRGSLKIQTVCWKNLSQIARTFQRLTLCKRFSQLCGTFLFAIVFLILLLVLLFFFYIVWGFFCCGRVATIFFTCESTANGKLNGELKILTEHLGFPMFLWWVWSLYSFQLDHRGSKMENRQRVWESFPVFAHAQKKEKQVAVVRRKWSKIGGGLLWRHLAADKVRSWEQNQNLFGNLCTIDNCDDTFTIPKLLNLENNCKTRSRLFRKMYNLTLNNVILCSTQKWWMQREYSTFSASIYVLKFNITNCKLIFSFYIFSKHFRLGLIFFSFIRIFSESCKIQV